MLQSGRTSEGLKNSQQSKKIPALQWRAASPISSEETRTHAHAHTYTHLSRWCCFSPTWRQPEALVSDKNKGITDQRSGVSADWILMFQYFHFLYTMNIHIHCWLICDYRFLFKRKHKVLKICLKSLLLQLESARFFTLLSTLLDVSLTLYIHEYKLERARKILKLLKQLWK